MSHLFRRTISKGVPAVYQPVTASSQCLSGIASFSSSAQPFSTAGYGDQSGDPISSKPQDQGPRPRIDTEHPGPGPVQEGKGKSGVKGKPVGDHPLGTAGDRSQSHLNNGSDTAADTSSSHYSPRKTGVDDISSVSSGGGGNGAAVSGSPPRPMISEKLQPPDGAEQNEDVKKHNREMSMRYNQKKVGDKEDERVDPKFWSGQGGRDREP